MDHRFLIIYAKQPDEPIDHVDIEIVEPLINIKPWFYCEMDDCGACFSRDSSLQKHNANHPVHPCTEDGCNVICKTGYKLKAHVKVCHTNYDEKKTYKCTLCTYSSYKEWNLSTHMRRVHPVLDTVLCKYCGKRFNSNDSFYGHYNRIHKKENEYSCARNTCLRRFKYSDFSKLHKCDIDI